MGDVRFVPDSAGYVELMKSGAMQGVLSEQASRIEASATNAIGPDWAPELELAPYASFPFMGKDRAGVRVQTHNPHADRAERVHGHLQNAAGV